jgi:hypothetical protein
MQRTSTVLGIFFLVEGVFLHSTSAVSTLGTGWFVCIIHLNALMRPLINTAHYSAVNEDGDLVDIRVFLYASKDSLCQKSQLFPDPEQK